MAQTETNLNRIVNIRVACQRLTRVLKPGKSLNFNNHVGPFSKENGYQPAPVLINGTTKPGYGGGTCQVSSTLYNVLMPLSGRNRRRLALDLNITHFKAAFSSFRVK